MSINTLITIFGWVATFYLVLCLLWDAQAWITTSNLYSRIPLRQATSMLKLVARSKIHYYLWSPIIPLFSILAFTASGTMFPFIFILSLILFWVHIFLYQILPPSIILLGTSRNETFQLRHHLERALYPYRVVALLEPLSSVSKSDSKFKKNIFEWDNLRTSEGLWKSTVFSLIDTIPFIVIDARVPAKGVVEEIRRVISQGYTEKALFVANEKGTAPALTDAGIEANENTLLSKSQVAITLKRLGLRHTTSPDDDPLLQRFEKK